MNFITPIDASSEQIIAICSIEYEPNVEALGTTLKKEVISKYKVVDVFYINYNIEWIEDFWKDKSIEFIKKDIEHNSYHSQDIKDEKQVIEMIFIRDIL